MDVVCVTGMHRSGTSLLGQIVHTLGVDLGAEESLLPASDDNPGGFWENREIKRVNDRVLRTLGGSWHEPPVLAEGWQNDPVLDAARKDAASVLAQEAGESKWFGWKDPRTSLTLPFWLTVTRVDRAVVCLREPHAVASSLTRRNGFPTEKSAGLWLLYTVNAWVGHPNRLLVRYADVVANVEESTRSIARHLGVGEPSAETLRQLREVRDPALDHHASSPRVGGPLMDLAEKLMDALTTRDEVSVRPVMEALERLTRVRRLTDDLAAREPGEGSAEEVLGDELGASRASIWKLKQMTAQNVERTETERRRRTRSEMDSLRKKERQARTKFEEQGKEAEAAEQERDQARAERNAAKEEVARLASELERSKEEAAAANRRADEAQSRAAEADAKRESAERDRKATRQQYERLRKRRSVKIATRLAQTTRPVFRVVRQTRMSDRLGGGTRPRGEGDRAPGGWEQESTRQTREQGGKQGSGRKNRANHWDWADAAERLREVEDISIIIPVFNAPEAVRRCVNAVIRNTSRRAELLIIDDASTDPAIPKILHDVQAVAGVRVLHNKENQGFTETVNRGLKEATGDVVILNSDTEVPPRWIENLSAAAYHDPTVGTVTPLSNNAGAFSAPTVGKNNPLPAWVTLDELGRRVTGTSNRLYPRTPTGNGFCLYIRRELLNDIGYLDSESFPRGYGEENDFCMRALEAGWSNVVDDATFVVHELGASFGDERPELSHQAREVVDGLHPSYTERIRAFVRSGEMDQARSAVKTAMEERATETPLRVLFVLHSGRGGTPATNVDLMESLQPDVECLVLESDTKILRLREAQGRELIEIESQELDPPLRFGEGSRPDYRRFVARVLIEYGIELVHVRHLVKHTFDVPDLAKTFRIPLVVSLHDYYLSCPTTHLLDERDQFCGGTCTSGMGSCRVPMQWIADDVPPLKHQWVYEWRSRVFPVLSGADALVTTTGAAQEPYLQAYPELAQQRWEIIEHGRDLEQSEELYATPKPGGIVRLLLPGNLDVHKGSEFIKALKSSDEGGRLEFHFLGDVPEELKPLGKYHGTYKRDEFPDLVKKIRPSLVGLFSIWAETYMHTLTEAWGAGIPVVASDIGALGERIRSRGGGWLVDAGDPQEAYDRILEIVDQPSMYQQGLSSASVRGLPTGRWMGGEYLRLYRSVMRRRQRFVQSCAKGMWGSREMKAQVLVVGEEGHPGSAHVRALRRFWHPDARKQIDARVSHIGEAMARLDDCDFLYIERTAVPPERTKEVVERTQHTGTPLVLDIDDNLLSEAALEAGGRGEWVEVVESLRLLARHATLVTVSTETLAAVAREYCSQVLVLPNMLDERLWFAPLRRDEERQRRNNNGGLQLLYMGTRTHEADLAMFRPIMERVWADVDDQAVLNVIGGELEREGKAWYRKIEIPKGCSSYPRFVGWLRSLRTDWDVGIAPLAANKFNRYKSDLKFLEYSSLGIPGVYSRSEAYAQSVSDGETGLLADASGDDWVEKIGVLAEDSSLRNEILKNSREYVVTSRTFGSDRGDWIDKLCGWVWD